MNDCYQVLGVSLDAGDDEIRRRYLELVRRHPPDRDPERFAEIRRAYEELRDPVPRIERQIMHPEFHDSLDAVVAEMQQKLRSARIPTQVLLSLAEMS
jgi:curved DNA-binding protein CbpA